MMAQQAPFRVILCQLLSSISKVDKLYENYFK